MRCLLGFFVIALYVGFCILLGRAMRWGSSD